MHTEAIPTNHPHDDDPIRHPDSAARLAELARRQGIKPASERELPPPIVVSDEEFEDFQRMLRRGRGHGCECL